MDDRHKTIDYVNIDYDLGILYQKAGKTRLSISRLETLIAAASTSEVQNDYRISIALSHLAMAYVKEGKADVAIQLLSKAYRAYEGNKSDTYFEAYSRAYEMVGDMSNALHYLKLGTEQSKARISDGVVSKLDLLRKQGILEKEKHEKEILKLKLQQSEEKLATSALHIASQTDLLDKFRNDLRGIVREIDEPIAALKRVKEKLKELPCSQIDWTKFEAQFNELHPNFKEKLAEKYPELTKMEQRIAVMVRMDLKSVDIAKLFCITERAVEFHRLNLRKKLDLHQNESLSAFLKKI